MNEQEQINPPETPFYPGERKNECELCGKQRTQTVEVNYCSGLKKWTCFSCCAPTFG